MVLGGGTAGTIAVNRLRKHLARDEWSITVVDGGVELVLCEIDRIDAVANCVLLADGQSRDYDFLIIASGTSPRPDQTPGMEESEWRKSIFDFHTLPLRSGVAAFTKPVASKHLGGGGLSPPCRPPAARLERRPRSAERGRRRGDRAGEPA